MAFSGKDILQQLDLTFKGIPNEYFPHGRIEDVKYNFILDLEHGNCCHARCCERFSLEYRYLPD